MKLFLTIVLLGIQAICLAIIFFTVMGWRNRARNSSEQLVQLADRIED